MTLRGVLLGALALLAFAAPPATASPTCMPDAACRDEGPCVRAICPSFNGLPPHSCPLGLCIDEAPCSSFFCIDRPPGQCNYVDWAHVADPHVNWERVLAFMGPFFGPTSQSAPPPLPAPPVPSPPAPDPAP